MVLQFGETQIPRDEILLLGSAALFLGSGQLGPDRLRWPCPGVPDHSRSCQEMTCSGFAEEEDAVLHAATQLE